MRTLVIGCLWTLFGVTTCTESEAIEAPPPAAGSLTPSVPLQVARALHTATRLNDGRVLIVGGGSAQGKVAAELYDPSRGTSRTIALTVGRVGHTATLLRDGTVLIVGGGWGGSTAMRSAELFEPATGTFRSLGQLNDARSDHGAVLLGTGEVLILGGDSSGVGSTPTATAEIYDPATRTFRMVGTMHTPRRVYGATLLADGRVLVPAGTTTGKRVISESELYDPRTRTFARTGAMRVAREKHAAVRLADGRILIGGGSDRAGAEERLRSTEYFDPPTGTFTAGPAMHQARHKITAVARDDGSVLFVGGASQLVEEFDARTNTFSSVRNATAERYYPTATLLADGAILITGGYTADGSRKDAWIYRAP